MLSIACSKLVAGSRLPTWVPALASVPSAGNICSSFQQQLETRCSSEFSTTRRASSLHDQEPSSSKQHAATSGTLGSYISHISLTDRSIGSIALSTTIQQQTWGAGQQQPCLLHQSFRGWALSQSSPPSTSAASSSSSMDCATSLQQLRPYKSLKKSMKPLNARASRLAVQPYLPPPDADELRERNKFREAPVIDSAIPSIPEVPKPAVYRQVGTITAEYSLDLQPVFGVVEIAGRQFKVTPDDIIFVNHMADVAVNEVLALDRVMLLGTRDQTVIGRPYVPNACVLVAVEEHFKDGKVHVFKFKKRNRYKKYAAPREAMTALRVLQVNGVPGGAGAQVAITQQLPIAYYKGRDEDGSSEDEVQQVATKAV